MISLVDQSVAVYVEWYVEIRRVGSVLGSRSSFKMELPLHEYWGACLKVSIACTLRRKIRDTSPIVQDNGRSPSRPAREADREVVREVPGEDERKDPPPLNRRPLGLICHNDVCLPAITYMNLPEESEPESVRSDKYRIEMECFDNSSFDPSASAESSAEVRGSGMSS